MRRHFKVGTGQRKYVASVVSLAIMVTLTSCSARSGESQGVGTTIPLPAPAAADTLGTKAGPDDASGPPKDGGKLVFGIEAEPEGLDPTRYAFSSSGHFVASSVFDPLVTLDAEGKVIPYLATSFVGSANHLTWTITLPTGVKFHDGTPLDADAEVKNLEAYRTSIITAGNVGMITSVKAPDATHVVIEINEPIVNFPSIFASQVGYVIAPAMITNPELLDKPIGSGPFIFEKHISGQSWSFRKNPDYRRKGLPHLDNLEIRPVPDNTERLRRLKAGDLDMINARSGAEILDLRATDLKRVENAKGEEQFFALNTQKPPFDSLTARRAVASAIDSKRYLDEVTLGVETPANGPFAPGEPGYLADTGYPTFDLDAAKKLAKQYEQESGRPFEVTFVTQADMNNQADSQLTASMLEAAGIKTTVTAVPQINLIAGIASGNYQMGRFRLFGHPAVDQDASTFWRSSNATTAVSLNFPRFVDPVVDSAIHTLLGTDDAQARTAALETINREFGKNVPYVWLGRADWILAANPRINGIYAATNSTVQLIGPKTWMADLWIKN